MSIFAQANDATGQTDDFFAYDATGQIYNGSEFVAWADANYATYRIAATEQGVPGGGSCEYAATLPTGTVRYKMRRRGATLILSPVVWTEDVMPLIGTPANGTIAADIAGVPNATFDLADPVETGWTLRKRLRVMFAALAGKSSGHNTNVPKYRDTLDTKNRINATTSSDGRTAITLDGD